MNIAAVEDTEQPLLELFDRLDSPQFSYAADDTYATFEDGEMVDMHASEILMLGRDSPRESVLIACIPEDDTRVAYTGMKPKSMKRILDSLRLPSYSENLGEKLFLMFRESLDCINGPVHLEQKITQGSEYKLELVLRRFSHVYSGNRIDQEFYRSLKQP